MIKEVYLYNLVVGYNMQMSRWLVDVDLCFIVENYATSYKDSVIALKFKPDHMKAINRAIQCSLQLRKYDQAIYWCDNGLKVGDTSIL